MPPDELADAMGRVEAAESRLSIIEAAKRLSLRLVEVERRISSIESNGIEAANHDACAAAFGKMRQIYLDICAVYSNQAMLAHDRLFAIREHVNQLGALASESLELFGVIDGQTD